LGGEVVDAGSYGEKRSMNRRRRRSRIIASFIY
jgi:hypothetical protein